MLRALRYYKVESYVLGMIPHPEDTTSSENWEHNDNFTQLVIKYNVTASDMTHIGQCTTSDAMWRSLWAIYESTGHSTIAAIMRNLFQTSVAENGNVIEHLTQMKQYQECLNAIRIKDFMIINVVFEALITTSLPRSWDTFTQSYLKINKLEETVKRKLMSSQEYIGILKEEYIR